MKIKWCAKPVYLAITLALVFSLGIGALAPQVAMAQTWPSSWVLIDSDPAESTPANDYRDVALAYYNCDGEYLYLRLENYALPEFDPVGTRYKWIIDTGVGDNLNVSGQNILGAEYLLFVEDTDDDGDGEVYLLIAWDNSKPGWDDSFAQYEPNAYATTPGPITDPTVAGYRFDGNSVDLYVKLSELGVSSCSEISLAWATDQENPNLEQGPTLDSVDGTDLPIQLLPVIDVTKTDTPDPVQAGQNITYTVTITNSGNMDVIDDTGNEFEDPIPLNTTYAPDTITVNGTPNGDDIADGIGYDSVNNQIIWNGDVLAGGSVTIVFQVTVDSPLPNGTQISNQGTVYWDSDSEPSDDPLVTELDNDPTITTVESAPVLMINKDDWPEPVEPGQILSYTITYQNTGNEVATNVVITETYDSNVTFSSASPAPDSGTENTWTILSLSPLDGPQTITIDVTVSSPLDDGTILNNYVSIACDEGVSDDDSEATTVSSEPILLLSKADNPDPVLAGGSLTYTITYQNVGEATATGTIITDTLPPEVTYDSADPLPTSVSDGTLTWTIGDLAPDGPQTITINVTVLSTIADQTYITDNASITCTNLPDGTDAEVTTVMSAPVLAVEKTDDPDPVEAGGTLTYNITVSNSGSADATGVTVIDDYDQSMLSITDTDGGVDDGDTITWDGGITITAGGSVSFTITAVVASPVDDGAVVANAVSATSAEGAQTGTEIVTTVHSAPALTIDKSDSPDPVTPGATLTYTLMYQNTGNAVACDVTITDYLPSEVTYNSADPLPTSVSDGTLTWDIGDLAPDGAQTIIVNVTVKADTPYGTTFWNVANIRCSQDLCGSARESSTVVSPPVAVAVGGESISPNKVAILAPWVGLVLIVAIGGSLLARRRRSGH